MIKATCIQKFRNKNNQIYGYRLQDSQGNTKDAYADQLKQAIKMGQITVLNLTLTSDNRLVDTTEKQIQQPTQEQNKISEEQQIQDLILKAKVLGVQLNIRDIKTCCGHKCKLISKSETQHILYIPDDVTRLNRDGYDLHVTQYIENLQGCIKVIGGHYLEDTRFMFLGCNAKTLNMSSFDTSKVKNMISMFAGCRAESLDLSSFNTHNVTTMENMFNQCKSKSINLSSFDTSSVTDMSGMFSGCEVQSLDLSSFNTSSVYYMHSMFNDCQAKSINLSSFNTSKVTEMGFMFYGCEAQSINLSSFDTKEVGSMNNMFSTCKAEFIDLSSFNTSRIENIKCMKDMFFFCEAKIKATDSKILQVYKESR